MMNELNTSTSTMPGAPAGPARIFWSALAAVDAIALVWVATKVDWADFEMVQVGPTPAGWIIVAALFAMAVAFKIIAAVFVASVAYAIFREFKGGWAPSRITAVFVSLVLVTILCVVGYLAFAAWRPIVAGPGAFFIDRLLAFDGLAKGGPIPGETIGAYLAALCVTAYLAEKYLLRWWGLHWPISLAAIAILAWPAWIVNEGERHQREWVAAREWRAVGENQTWLEALVACKALGVGWRMPARGELSMYAAIRPEETRAWKGAAWTHTTAEFGRTAVVVDLVPRQSGMWRSNTMPWRDRSVCEGDASPGRTPPPHDWFSDLRAPLCSSTERSPGLYPAGLRLLAELRGSVVGGPEPKLMTSQTQAAAVCVKEAQADTLPPSRGRAYPRETDFTDLTQFLTSMRELCHPRAPGSDAVACAAFAGEPASALVPPASISSVPACPPTCEAAPIAR